MKSPALRVNVRSVRPSFRPGVRGRGNTLRTWCLPLHRVVVTL